MERSKNYDPRLKLDKGCYQECLWACQCIYQNSPSDVDNLLLLAACHFQLNHMQESMFYAKQAVGVAPRLVEAMLTIGNALRELGHLENATELYNKALRIQPRFAHAYAALGCIQFQQGRLNEAKGCFEMAVTLDPSFKRYLGLALAAAGDKAGGKAELSQLKSNAIARLGLGNLAHEEGDFDAAMEHYSQAIRLQPSFINAATNLCGSQIESFKITNNRIKLQEATSRLKQTVVSFKSSRSAHTKLGLCHRHEGQHKLAHHYLWRAVTLDPTNTDSLCNLAALLAETGRNEQAVKLCLEILHLDPRHAVGFGTLGLAFFQSGLIKNALKCLRAAKQLEPNPTICSNLGSALNEMGDVLEAAKLHKRAIALDPFNIPAFLNMGNSYFGFGQKEYAEKCYQTSIDSKTEYSLIALNNLALLYLSKNQVGKSAKTCIQLHQKLGSNSNAVSPTLAIANVYVCQWANRINKVEPIVADNFCNMSIQPFYSQIDPQITPVMALSISNMFSRRFHHRALLALGAREKEPHENKRGQYKHPEVGDFVRIGYVSSGFGNHASSFLFDGMFACHNRDKFEVVCFSLTASDDSPQWKNVQACSDLLVDLSRFSCVDAADIVHEHEINVLVDLDGYCQGALPEMFTLQPAPIQITMNCGTMGSESGIDYIVADKYTIPEHHRSHYSEKVIYMPNILCSKGEIGVTGTRRKNCRRKYGISDDTFVYACFSQPYKIDPELFASWMKILHEAPNSYLLLVKYSAVMEENLRKEAANHQIAKERVVFLDLAPRHDHLARCCMVDVFLDTRVCSGIATSCDALLSGAPLITIAGDRMCNRVGASLVYSLGVKEFIASNLKEYKELAVTLSEDKDKFIDIIHVLDDARDNSNIFDCQLWMQTFETSLESCIERHAQHLEPDHIVVNFAE